jgi:hypothetical protein
MIYQRGRKGPLKDADDRARYNALLEQSGPRMMVRSKMVYLRGRRQDMTRQDKDMTRQDMTSRIDDTTWQRGEPTSTKNGRGVIYLDSQADKPLSKDHRDQDCTADLERCITQGIGSASDRGVRNVEDTDGALDKPVPFHPSALGPGPLSRTPFR